ncbi:MAG: TetR family transcriptional regulator [Gemmatimonadetes bacterium]|nr:TetR family transcriptional regulator [Gemmatimonadota bacterium]
MADEQAPHDEKLTLILRTAAAIFAEKGYHRASIRDISRATGISLSGLYYYVPSKEAILFRIQQHAFGTVVENLERRLDGVTDPEERLRLFIENHLRFFVANMKEMKVLSHEATALSGELRERVAALKRRYTEICTGILAALRPEADAASLRVATFSLFGMMNWIYNWYHPGRDVPVDALAAEMMRIFLRGYVDGVADGVARPLSGGAEAAPTFWR